MLKLGGAVIPLLKNNKITYVVGSDAMIVEPMEPYADLCCEFLNDFSVNLLHDVKASVYPDIVAFAFWCRKANIDQCKKEFIDGKTRLGLGLAFHIAPANVPINFAFSFAYGLLAGNANIVRVPSRTFPQIEILAAIVNQLFKQNKYHKIKEMTAWIRYEKYDEITAYFSSLCNARIIWGGDETIVNIRRLSISPRTIELTFADRYSFCILATDSLVHLNDVELKKIAERFYNDNYFMDQNICSAAHLVVWYGKENAVVRERFWKILAEVVANKYSLAAIQAVDKYVALCNDAINNANADRFQRYGNYVYTVMLQQLPNNLDNLRGRFGYFYEYQIDNLSNLTRVINRKCQTLTYFGVNPMELLHWLTSNHLLGIDRIVPIGEALNIGMIWDGYDIIKTLSRIIEVK